MKLFVLLLFLGFLPSCGMDRAAEQGVMAVEEAYDRGFTGFITCERERNLARTGFKWNPDACQPVGAPPPQPAQ